MSRLDIENSIIDQIKTVITDLKVEGTPDNAADYKLLHPKGAVLVHYIGSKYGTPEIVFQSVQQLKNLEFSIALFVKGLRDKNGAYHYLDLIESTLTGFKPTGCLEMYPVSDELIDTDNGIFLYEFRFIVQSDNYK